MSHQTRVFYKGQNEDFIVFLDDLEAMEKYKTDSTIPMSQFLGSFDVFKSYTGGASGKLEKASKQELAEEFGDFGDVVNDVIPVIISKGQIQNNSNLSKRKKSIDGGMNKERFSMNMD